MAASSLIVPHLLRYRDMRLLAFTLLWLPIMSSSRAGLGSTSAEIG